MNIAMIGQKGMPAGYGGVERHVHDLSVRVVERGHQVTVYSRPWYTGIQEQIVLDGVIIKPLKSIKTKHLDTISHTFLATTHAMLEGFDVIHYHGVGPSLLSWLPRIFTPKTRVITTFHSIDRYHEKWNWFARLILRLGEHTACWFAHETVTISPSLEQYCEREFHRKTMYIPNGVQERDIASMNVALNEFGLEKQEYVLAVARLIPCKAVHVLVDAFVAMKQANPNDREIQRLKLVVVGGPVFTDDYVKALHMQASICNDIIFTGFQSPETVIALYGQAKVVVHPSLVEGLPLTVLEAMVQKTPVLVSDIPQHLQLVKDHRCIFAQNDAESLRATLYDYLQMRADEVEEIINSNKQFVDTHYNWDLLVPQIVELYQEKKTTKAGVVAMKI